MADYILNKNKLGDFTKFLADKWELWAPVKQGARVEMAPAKPEEVVWDAPNTHLSPKAAFFPQTERLMAFHTDKDKPNYNVYQETAPKTPERVMLGIRPCDSRGLQVANRVFQNDRFTDPYWKDKYEATTFIGLGCPSPCVQCFCSKVGGGPLDSSGLDVLAVLAGDEIIFRTVTPKGEFLMTAAKGAALGLKEGDQEAALNKCKTEAEAAITARMPLDKVAKKEIMQLFNEAHWVQTGERCLNCGVCTFVCPTCHCFDIQDEADASGGVRMRNWDSCMSWLFTLHGSGHNPRTQKSDRVRQRFMHKLKYIPLKQDGACGCIGCGRCVVQCPVNIDIREVAVQMNA